MPGSRDKYEDVREGPGNFFIRDLRPGHGKPCPYDSPSHMTTLQGVGGGGSGGRGQGPLTKKPLAPSPQPSASLLITGAILAGGGSRRLGQDKAVLHLGGRALALWVAAALAPVVSACWLITNQPLAHLSLGLPLVTDLVPFQGPVGGLITAMFYARTPWVLAAAVDNPFLAPPLIAELVVRAATTARPAVVCRSSRGLEPFPGVYAVRLLPRLTEFLQSDRRTTRFLEVCRPQVLTAEEVKRLDPQEHSFFNLNTSNEMEQAKRWLAAGGEITDPHR